MSFCRRFPVPERRSSLPGVRPAVTAFTKASKGFKKRTRAFAFSARPKGALVAFLPAVLADETLHRPHEVADFVESGAHESNEPLDVHGRNLIGDVAFELFPQNLFGRSMTHGRNRPKRTKRVGRKPPHDGCHVGLGERAVRRPPRSCGLSHGSRSTRSWHLAASRRSRDPRTQGTGPRARSALRSRAPRPRASPFRRLS